SPNGNDANPGAREKPVATLESARDLLRKLKAENVLPKEGVTVWIAAGRYEQQHPFILNERDSGLPGAPIVWRAMQPGQVSITGGRCIPRSHFTHVTDEQSIKRLTPEAAKQVLQADLRKLGIQDFGEHQQYGHALSVCPAPLELFYNGEPMPLARYPNAGSMRIGKVIDPGSAPRNGDYTGRGATFEYTDARHEVWARQRDVCFQGTFNYGFADDSILMAAWRPPGEFHQGLDSRRPDHLPRRRQQRHAARLHD
ncbi:MAG: hypothetical protein NT154_18075, partial [Verrucomicrobia bacterium]|nr:hypothetical protein [Verrucomicrobiota bacterium]